MRGVTFRRVPVACTEFFLEPDNQFSSPARLAAMRTSQEACVKHWQLKNANLNVRAQTPVCLFFCVSRLCRVARRNEEECYMHIAHSLRPALYRCIAPPRGLKSPPEKSVC